LKKVTIFLDNPTYYRTLAALGASVLLPSGTTRGRCILQKIKNKLKAKEISVDKNQTNHALKKKTTTVCFE
jgi:hypothetical protein